MEKPGNDFLWSQFCKLGEMIGDGLHHEEPWIVREYKKLQRILLPPTKEELKLKRDSINAQMERLMSVKTCECGGKLEQTRSGSKTCKCTICDKKFKARKVKK